MKHFRLSILFIGLLASINSIAQGVRYMDQIFTEDQITLTSDVVYGTNIRFLPPVDFATAEAQANVAELQGLADMGNGYPAAYFDLSDASTTVKLRALTMDVYQPDPSIDDLTDRPVLIYLHTGNFLPPPTNGSPTGLKTDSLAIRTCTEFARRGFVCFSVAYRWGWNPLGSSVERRGTLLNAVYRAIQDTRESIRFIKDDATNGSNQFGIDPSKIVLFGEGSGGYVALGCATVDNLPAEIEIPKFLNPVTGTSYVDPSVVGDEEGFNGLLTLYRDNGQTSDIQMTINLGGALGDISWLEQGDAPMVSFHAVRDDFAPFGDGTVIVPTTQEDVVDVSGSNVFIQAANDFGNNDVFADIPDGDPFTDQARSLYGVGPIEQSLGASATISSTPEGLFPILVELRPFLQNVASPWQWWDPESPIATTVVGESGGMPITAHQASLGSNPNMSPEQGRTYLDTIQGYAVPRIILALDLPLSTSDELVFENSTQVYPNPAIGEFTIKNDQFIIQRVELMDITGRVVTSEVVNAGIYTVNRTNYSDGVYLLNVYFEGDNRVTKKVLFN